MPTAPPTNPEGISVLFASVNAGGCFYFLVFICLVFFILTIGNETCISCLGTGTKVWLLSFLFIIIIAVVVVDILSWS